ncbi:transcription initiation factor TFIID 23-30kDa subunit-domain-containing protein [Cristinia sonorae]|uniref:Transcription initiation factor TFIID subunit 10 n=1 Tax=Cristinia sonorae TaxID=1940300 RepID=A0A8K0UU31_9AGAR|nr:transcription initiation factor TFIID 23-30kDa subunit-domain-containing protein [Cristinia sonorae]
MTTPYQDAASQQSSAVYQPFTAETTPSTPDPSQVAGSSTQVGSSTQATQQQPPSRQTAEEARRNTTLAEFLLMLDDYEPLIPNEVTDYYLQRVGFECEDPRLKRLLSLAAQKFVSDIAADAYQHARIRTNASGGRSRVNVTGPQSARDKTKTTLMMEDLSAALAEYGITSRKPEFYM